MTGKLFSLLQNWLAAIYKWPGIKLLKDTYIHFWDLDQLITVNKKIAYISAYQVIKWYSLLQDRLAAINKEIAHVSSRQEDVLQQLENAKESSDNDNVTELQSSLEKITNRHLQLLTEQSDLLRKQRWVYIHLYMPNEISHPYQWDKSILNLRVAG